MQQIGDGNPRRTGPIKDHLDLIDRLFHQCQGIEQGGEGDDDREQDHDHAHAVGEGEGEVERWLLEDWQRHRPEPVVFPAGRGPEAEHEVGNAGSQSGLAGGCAGEDRDEGEEWKEDEEGEHVRTR